MWFSVCTRARAYVYACVDVCFFVCVCVCVCVYVCVCVHSVAMARVNQAAVCQ